MYCKKVSGVSVPISLSRRSESKRTAEQTRRDDPQYLEALNWINSRRRGNERRQTAADRLADAKPGEDVKLDHLALTSLPESLMTRASTAKSISLSGNSLPAIPPVVLSFSEVQRLNVSGNELSFLSPQISQMQNLRSLDASHNAIAEVPSTIGALTKLESLNLGDNALRAVTSTIGKLSKLKQLKLSGNMLSDLPPQIAQCTSLRELDISRNHFEVVPDTVGSLRKLRTLKADRNRLTDLEPSADHPDSVEDRAIPESIGNLPRLEEFSVEGNPLSTLPNTFGPFEYVSRRRFQITRQGTNTLVSKVLSNNLKIRIANTPLPETLVTDGRLTDAPGAAPPPVPVYEPLYHKESPAFMQADPPPVDELAQRPIAQMAHVMPELFAAQTTSGPTGGASFDQFVRQTAGHDMAHHAQQHPQPQPQQHPQPQAQTQQPPTQQNEAVYSVFSESSSESDAPSFAFVRKRTTPPVQAPNAAPSASAAVNVQTPPPATTQPFIPTQIGAAWRPSGSSPATPPATAVPPSTQIPQQQPAPAQAQTFPTMPMGTGLPASGFQHTTHDPQAAAYAQALQMAASLMQRPATTPHVHSAPFKVAGSNDSWFDFSDPAINQAHQHELDMLGFEQVQHNTLDGLAKHYRERLYLQGDHLKQRLEQAKLRGSMGIPGETVGINVWRVGIMLFRQHVVCNLAETVANINKQKKLNDPSQSHLADDPLQIALVYQTIVSRELQILGLEPLRKNMDENPHFRSMFAHIVSPERTGSVMLDIIREVHRAEDENGRRKLSAFIKEQPFWKEYLASQQSASTAAWRGSYGF
jgi:hypothetical protein